MLRSPSAVYALITSLVFPAKETFLTNEEVEKEVTSGVVQEKILDIREG